MLTRNRNRQSPAENDDASPELLDESALDGINGGVRDRETDYGDPIGNYNLKVELATDSALRSKVSIPGR